MEKVFDKNWLQKHQSKLLWFLNTPVVKYGFRWILGMETKCQIIELQTNGYWESLGLIWTATDGLQKRVRLCANGVHATHVNNLRNRLFPLWLSFHVWDLFADRFTPSLSFGFVTLLDSYSESNRDDRNSIGDPSGVAVYTGQAFTTPNDGISYTLDSMKFYNNTFGSPTGNIISSLYAHTGTYGTSSTPTGSSLANSDNVDVSTLAVDPSYALQTYNFTSGNRVSMTANTHYCAVLYYAGGSAGHVARMGVDVSSPTAGGNSFYSPSVVSWTAQAGVAGCFYVYGVAPAVKTGNMFQVF